MPRNVEAPVAKGPRTTAQTTAWLRAAVLGGHIEEEGTPRNVDAPVVGAVRGTPSIVEAPV
eukprot:4358825-Pyramimonas_sp.AAC.1